MLKRLIHEIHRRSLWQVVGIYLAGSWIGYQVILGLTDGLGLPDWVPPFAFILFIIGLPIVTATAFVQEGPPRRDPPGPEGLATSQALPTSPADAPSHAEAPAHADPSPRTLQQFLTWPRAIVGGILAFALLGAGTTGWVGMRAMGIGPAGSLVAAGTLEKSERILVADFHSPTGHEDLARVVTEAFRIDLSRATLVRLVEPAAVREVLQRMERADEPFLSPELAREVALRDGINVYMSGEVSRAGTGWVISTRLVSTSTGETLLGLRETARDSADIVPAIDRLSRQLRERTGESLRTIRREPPLEQVTTPSLEALQKYTEGRRAQGLLNQREALELFEEAVALDSAFAAAWRGIAVVRSNFGEPELALEALERALWHRDRMTEMERLHAVGMQHTIRREYTRAIEAFSRAVAIDSMRTAALNNIGLQYSRLGDLPRAEQFYRRAVALDSAVLNMNNLGEVLVRLGRIDEARSVFQAIVVRNPQSWMAARLAVLPSAQHDYAATERGLRALRDDPATPQLTVQTASRLLGATLGVRGRPAEAARIQEQLARARGDLVQAELAPLWQRFWFEAELGDPGQARATLARVRPIAERAAEADSVYFEGLAWACAVVGDAACARGYLARAGLARPLQPWTPTWVYELHAAIARAEGDYATALRLLRDAPADACPSCLDADLGRTFLEAGQPDSAIVAWERFLGTPDLRRLDMRGPEIAFIHRRLAALYEDRGDAQGALRHYARITELWQDGDAVVQPHLQTAIRAVQRLMGDGRPPGSR